VSSRPTAIEARDLKKYYPIRKGLLGRIVGQVKAVQGVSFSIDKGKTYALVGESGCGKTTTSRVVLRLRPPTAGKVLWNGNDIWDLEGRGLRDFQRKVQAVFQDPVGSMNPRMKVRRIVAEPIRLGKLELDSTDEIDTVVKALESVDLHADDLERYPHEFSGGQRQRIAIARALVVDPELIVLDEPVSALDVSVRAQIMNLLGELQQSKNLSYLLIAHHLATVRYLSDTIGVMYLGRIVEEGTAAQIVDNPQHPYSQALVEASLPAVPGMRDEIETIRYEVSSPINPPQGCEFHPRCPEAMDICSAVRPPLVKLEDGRRVACHLHPRAEMSLENPTVKSASDKEEREA